jgi:ribonuclease HI
VNPMCDAGRVTTEAYTDGACKGNPGPGGWAWAVPDGPFASGAEARSTNQRMEIKAAYEAVKANPGRLEVVSDSTYVVHCFRDRWWEGWKRKGWVNSQRKPVANRDLWEPFVDLVAERGDVTFRWVKGHAGDPMNDLVDRLAVEAATTQTGRADVLPPDELGPPDDLTVTPTIVRVEALTGHAVVVTGQGPPVVDPDTRPDLAGILVEDLVEHLGNLAEAHPDLVVVTGLRRGSEQLAAEAAVGIGAPYVAVLPWADPAHAWPDEDRLRFDDLVGEADAVTVLDEEAPVSRQAQHASVARRDDWLARHARAAVVVWDGVDERVGRQYRGLFDHLGGDAVTVVAPPSTP